MFEAPIQLTIKRDTCKGFAYWLDRGFFVQEKSLSKWFDEHLSVIFFWQHILFPTWEHAVKEAAPGLFIGCQRLLVVNTGT